MDKRIYGSSRELFTTLVCLTGSVFIRFGRRIYGSVSIFKYQCMLSRRWTNTVQVS